MEEKKNNKGLIIGLIIFLIICLILVFYFMFKMVYKEPSTNINETSNTETNSNEEKNSVVFTELTKYTLEEGEEKEVTVDNKKIKFKVENGIYYLNGKEVGKLVNNLSDLNLYTTNNMVIYPYFIGQSGYQYYINDFEGKKINVKYPENEINQYVNIRIKNNRLFVDIAQIGDGPCINEAQCFFEKLDILCTTEKNKDINEYSNELEKYKNEPMNITYEMIYDNKDVIIEKAEDINTIGKWIETFSKVCVIENNN